MKWWVGCSGFSYQGWKDLFYPSSVPQSFWFEYYCQFFNTVELNVTFYRVPLPAVFKGWYDRSPDDFRFTVKAPRLITHYRKFQSTRNDALQFYDRVLDGLQDKLGTVLFQLHPKMEFSEESLENILDSLDPSFKNVIEFRHNSWWNEKVVERLKEEKITFCSISYPRLPDEVIRTSEILYYRFHGVPQLYRTPYTDEELKGVIHKIKLKEEVTDSYLYFNNDNDANAVANAIRAGEIAAGSEPVSL